MAILLSFGLLFATNATAQNLSTEEGDITVGAGLALGTNVSIDTEIGINVNGFYTITDDIRAGANFTYYLIDIDGLSASEFNIDGHYMFRNEDQIVLYGLAGINIARVSVDTGFAGSVSGSSTGINLGGGVEYDVGSVLLFAEPKVSLGGFDQFNATAGVRLRFN